MISENDLEKIKEISEDFLKKTGFGIELESLFLKDETVLINLKPQEEIFPRGEIPSETAILIGEGGKTLFEIQHLLKAVLRKNIKENFYLDLDINNYKKKKTEYLKDLVRSIAEDVALTKQEKELPPMTPAERRIIHLELSQFRQDVTTQSVGQEPNRRIIIRPRP